jgi:two-component system sensor histidine kinase PilS (NtrC family)
MEAIKTERRKGWFLPLRLASYVVIMAVVVVWMGYPNYLHFQVVVYSLLTLGFAIAFSLNNRLHFEALLQIVVALQFLLEIAIESGVIYATGNVNSSFSALYLLTIVSAALAYRLVGTLVVASLVSLAYAFIIWLGLTQGGDATVGMQALRTIFSAQDHVFYSIFLHILIFYLVAFISGYLAERLSTQDRQLAHASRELRRAKLETDDILRHLNSGLLTIDSNGHIIYFNRAAERILGYTEEHTRGMHCEEVFAERMPHLAACLMDGIENKVAYPRKEIEIIDDDRNTIPLGLSTSILTEDGESLRGVIAIFSDLTEAKALESKMRIADRLAAVGELSASIAHEIRNPLAAISGSVEVLKADLPLSGENHRLMELIVRESDHLSNILTDFLAYARITRPSYNKVELCHIVNDVIELLHHHASFKDNIRVAFESDVSILYVVGDENLITQLLLNLALNACESFEGNGGEVLFRAAVDHQAGCVELFIQDSGPGLAENLRDRIFEPFFSSKKHGTGLGLSIVHRIVTALNLALNVDSQPGYGTTFLIQFKTYRQVAANDLSSVTGQGGLRAGTTA